MPNIHPTSLVSPEAKIAADVEIGPFCIVEGDVIIDSGTKLLSHVVVYNGARIGKNNKIFPGAVIAAVPQDLKFNNEYTEVFIGDNNTIREAVTISRATSATKKTVIGSNCLLMAYVHIAHDCVVGNNCILANCVELAGHVTLEDYVIIGGLTGVHQFTSIGQHSMIGACSKIVKDIPPYTLFSGNPIRYEGLNIIGLRRRGFSSDSIESLKNAYSILYSPYFNTTQAVEKIKTEIKQTSEVKNLLTFIEKSRRGISK